MDLIDESILLCFGIYGVVFVGIMISTRGAI